MQVVPVLLLWLLAMQVDTIIDAGLVHRMATGKGSIGVLVGRGIALEGGPGQVLRA